MDLPTNNRVFFQVKELKKHFPIRRGIFRRTVGWLPAVDGVNFFIRKGECFALVGESGCGKTTMLKTIVRAYEPTGGEIIVKENGNRTDIAKLDKKRLREMRKKIRVIFQDPQSSLNPRLSIRNIIAEPLKSHEIERDKSKIDRIVQELMRTVRLNPDHLRRYPYAFSGGERQRIGIARALATNPELIVADEPTSALDVSVQAQILNLLLQLQKDRGLTLLFVTHDLGVAQHISDRVAIMYLGKVVEIGDTDNIFSQPRHPYTEALISAIPIPDPHRPARPINLKGEIADVANRPSGCAFHPRCIYAETVCMEKDPALALIDDKHEVACHFPLD